MPAKASKAKVRHLTIAANRDGSARHYWTPSPALRAAGWRRQRLPDARADALRAAELINDRVDAWRQGLAAEPADRPAVTLGALITAYQAGDDFQALRGSTQRQYRNFLGMVYRWAGDQPAAGIGKRDVRALITALQVRTPAQASAVHRAIRLLYSWAIREEWAGITDNPAGQLKVAAPKPRPRRWTDRAIAAFVAAADANGRHSLGTAVLLNAWLGQREGDVISLPRSAMKSGELLVTQAKTGAQVALPVDMVPQLQARLAAEAASQRRAKLTATTLLVCEMTGRPWQADTFRHEIARLRDLAYAQAWHAGDAQLIADLEGVAFMHLRHTAVVQLAEAGATNAEISAITGHSLKTVGTILEHYLVRTRTMARNAFAKRLAAEGTPQEHRPKSLT